MERGTPQRNNYEVGCDDTRLGLVGVGGAFYYLGTKIAAPRASLNLVTTST